MDAQIAIFDESIRPDPRDEFILAHYLASTFDEGDEKGQRPAAQPNGLVSFEEHLAIREEAEGPK
jgi:hypothetical protein